MNLNIRAIKTDEKIKKIIESGFVPGDLYAYNKHIKVKFELKKIRRLFKHYNAGKIIKVKYNGKWIYCNIRNVKQNEITGFVEKVVFDQIIIQNYNVKNVPLVFEGDKLIFQQNKKLEVLLTELDVLGNDLPEYIKINIKDFISKQKLTVKNLREYLNINIMNDDNEIIFNILPKGKFLLAS